MAWEVVDVGQVVASDGQAIRWSYVVVLKETAGTAIRFESVERGVQSAALETTNVRTEPFDRRLDAGSELRVAYVDSLNPQVAAGQGRTAPLSFGMTVVYRYAGRDDNGNPVTTTVRVPLDRSVGKLAAPPVTRPLPPPKVLLPGELPRVAGRWRGHYEEDRFAVPLEATIGEDGRFEMGQGDPVYSRFHGSFVIQDGRLHYVRGEVTGSFELHESEGTRVLAGAFRIRAAGQPEVSRAVRLEHRP